MALLLGLLGLALVLVAWVAQPALQAKALWAGRLASWLLLSAPLILLGAMLWKDVGPLAWFVLPTALVSPWIGWPLLTLYLLAGPMRSLVVRALETRDDAILLETTRVFAAEDWPELGYRELCDRMGLRTPPPIHLGILPTAFAAGYLKPRILLPAQWIPAERRGQSDYWIDIEHLPPLPLPAIRAVLAHELGHHRDRTGLRLLIIELARLLVPHELYLGISHPLFWRRHRLPVPPKRWQRRARIVLTRISRHLARIGRLGWGPVILAERQRQERIADLEADRVLPGALETIASMRGPTAAEDAHHHGRPVATWLSMLSLAGALVLLAATTTLLPGRHAIPALFDLEAVIPGALPEGVDIMIGGLAGHSKIIHKYYPPRHGKPSRVVLWSPQRHQQDSHNLLQDSVHFISQTSLGLDLVPSGSRIDLKCHLTHHRQIGQILLSTTGRRPRSRTSPGPHRSPRSCRVPSSSPAGPAIHYPRGETMHDAAVAAGLV